MTQVAQMLEVYNKTAQILDEAKKELSSYAGSDPIYEEFLKLKVMGALIHNDCCREFYNSISNTTMGYSRLLAMGPIILKSYEAYLWYVEVGNKRLLELAKNRHMFDFTKNKFKEMKMLDPNRISDYKDFRDKFIAHYDDGLLEYVDSFGTVDVDKFYKDIEVMARYSQEWLKVLRAIGKLETK